MISVFSQLTLYLVDFTLLISFPYRRPSAGYDDRLGKVVKEVMESDTGWTNRHERDQTSVERDEEMMSLETQGSRWYRKDPHVLA